jgi:branched-chain amino acid aminotransferase
MVVLRMERWADKSYRLAISSWHRIEDNSIPPRIKCAANYQNGRLALIQAIEDGYDGVLMLDSQGHVTEEPRACFFMVRNGVPITTPITSDILESITRDSLIQLFQEQHGLTVQQRLVDRTELYVAEEVFLCGTAMEVTPVKSVDYFTVGDGTMGPITHMIRDTYMAVSRGNLGAFREWRTPIYV